MENKPKCEHGHDVELVNNCPACGAPQCCPVCCRETLKRFWEFRDMAQDMPSILDDEEAMDNVRVLYVLGYTMEDIRKAWRVLEERVKHGGDVVGELVEGMWRYRPEGGSPTD